MLLALSKPLVDMGNGKNRTKLQKKLYTRSCLENKILTFVNNYIFLWNMISKNKIKYVRSLEIKKNRQKDGVFVAEGHKLVGDLLPFFECVYLAATDQWIRANADCMGKGSKPIDVKSMNMEVDEVTDDELRRISFVETPQQVLAVFRQKKSECSMADIAKKELCLALDDVQNPGNLGTIIRLAAWFGIEHVFCSRGCADLYNPKTVQATMGAMAHVSVHYVDLVASFNELADDVPVYGTFLNGESIYSKPLKQHGVLVMGNEGKGVSAEVEAFVDERLYVPDYPEGRSASESLNVAIATAVVCAEFRRRVIMK